MVLKTLRVKHPVNNIVLILSAHFAVQNEYLTWNELIVLDKFLFAPKWIISNGSCEKKRFEQHGFAVLLGLVRDWNVC